MFLACSISAGETRGHVYVNYDTGLVRSLHGGEEVVEENSKGSEIDESEAVKESRIQEKTGGDSSWLKKVEPRVSCSVILSVIVHSCLCNNSMPYVQLIIGSRLIELQRREEVSPSLDAELEVSKGCVTQLESSMYLEEECEDRNSTIASGIPVSSSRRQSMKMKQLETVETTRDQHLPDSK